MAPLISWSPPPATRPNREWYHYARTEAIGVYDFLGGNFNSTLPLKIFTYQKGISNPQYVPNIEIEIDIGNSEWTHELRPRMYYQEFSHDAMHASYG